MTDAGIAGSFRDPSGFVFVRDGTLYRQVNYIYKEHYDRLIYSGLYEDLLNSGLLVPHEEMGGNFPASENAYKILRPEPLDFISYPYEWCFGQVKDTALALLDIQRKSLRHGMTLKDCPAYNMQFNRGKPVLIDTLSFEIYTESQPWGGYRQFCQHFLAPLALMSCKDIRLNQLSRVYMDGIPLDLAAGLLPAKAGFNFNLLLHIFMHAGSLKHYADRIPDKKALTKPISKNSFAGLIDSLETCVRSLAWHPAGDDWYRYYEDDSSFPDEYIDRKKQLVSEMLNRLKPASVWDLGANTGRFSRLATEMGIFTLSMDSDPACVESNYIASRKSGETHLLPLVIDITNPSPGIGWENLERPALWQRGHAHTALALALVHHLAISNNLPLNRIAAFFNKICDSLLIEFVPKSDPNSQRLLSSRADIFTGYTQEMFEKHFSQFFTMEHSTQIGDSGRILYLMTKGVK
jgi:hypothetical protein